MAGSSLCTALVKKLDPTGSTFLYSAYFGSAGSDNGCSKGGSGVNGIAVDAAGNAYVTGATTSLSFPTTANAFQQKSPETPGTGGRSLGDAFVVKFDTAGSMVYSSYLGGKSGDAGTGIALDDASNALVTGWTRSIDFPTANAVQPDIRGVTNAFVAKLDPPGSALVYATYLGGNAYDTGAGIAMDRDGNAFVTGLTGSRDFLPVNAAQPASGGGECYGRPCHDAFASKLSPSGRLIYSTYLGGSNDDSGAAITTDAVGNVYLAGQTQSSNSPLPTPCSPPRVPAS